MLIVIRISKRVRKNTKMLSFIGSNNALRALIRTLSFQSECDTFKTVFFRSVEETVWALFLIILSAKKSLSLSRG